MGNSVTHLFEYEKPEVLLSLPSNMKIWPKLHRQLSTYKEQVGGTLPNALRWAARYGASSLLQNATGVRLETVGISRQDIEIEMLLSECERATGMSRDEATRFYLLRGLQMGQSLGFVDHVAEREPVTAFG